MEASENMGEVRLLLSGLYHSSCCLCVPGGGGTPGQGHWLTGPGWWEYAPEGRMGERRGM